MKTMMTRSALLLSAFLVCISVDAVAAQRGTPSKPTGESQQTQTQQPQTQQTGPNTVQGLESAATQNRKPLAAQPASPWRLTSRIHLEQGGNTGYLVVQLDLADGYHVYSLNPQGSPSPTKLLVAPSNDLKIQSKFMADKNPKVIEKDPVFEQRIEKHSGQIQFFASIAVRPGIDLKTLKQEVQFSGQICSETACQPIRNHKANAVFSGYFAAPKARSAAETQQLK